MRRARVVAVGLEEAAAGAGPDTGAVAPVANPSWPGQRFELKLFWPRGAHREAGLRWPPGRIEALFAAA